MLRKVASTSRGSMLKVKGSEFLGTLGLSLCLEDIRDAAQAVDFRTCSSGVLSLAGAA